MNKSQRLFYTSLCSFLFQVTVIICGLIIPKIQLDEWGSDIYGLITSIKQFLGIIALMDVGINQVVQSNLFRFLVEHDDDKISDLASSANRFYKTFICIIVIYTVLLSIFYPLKYKEEFGYLYVATLIVIVSADLLIQNYIALPRQILLNADQRGYVQYSVASITMIINVFISYILIKTGQPVHIVKVATCLIYMLRPIIIIFYSKRIYPNISFDRKLDYEPISQKWNGVAQHISSVVLTYTDTIVITIFSTLSNVAIYSVYNLIVSGVKQLAISLTNGFLPVLGELYHSKDKEKFKDIFFHIEWGIHTGTVILFGCTGILLIPFVEIYTSNVTDTNYIIPEFATLIVCAHAFHCIRLPYNISIMAAGHYKQTQSCYIWAAVINLLSSIILVNRYGLVGVAIGTLLGMSYHTFWLVLYLTQNIVCLEMSHFIKRIVVDVIVSIIAIIICKLFPYVNNGVVGWIQYAFITVIVWIAVSLTINFISDRYHILFIMGLIKKRKK